ncbi:MAG: hypothetical protein JW820_09885 [Spirochaetales bacterium]|nr:hypothetical protein [Spirochaetales bacterium]
MKKVLIVLVVLALIGGVAWSQEARKPIGAVSFLLGGSVVAPIGVGVEFFLGHLGLGIEARGLFIAVEGEALGTFDPGALIRFYFSDLDSSLYLMGGASYLTVWDTEVGAVAGGLLKPKAGVGYNGMFGRDNRIRFNVELGGVGFVPLVEGEFIEGMPAMILPHFLIGFGYAF